MKTTITFIILFYSSLIIAQVPRMIKVDSMWVLQTVTPNGNKGAHTVAYTERVDSAKIVAYYINVMSQKKAVIDSALLQREWDQYDAHLRTITGKGYTAHVSAEISRSLDGEWEVIHSADTLTVTVKDLRITGGKIKGSVKVLDPNTFTISGVLPDAVTLKVSAAYTLTGILQGKPVIMRKNK